MPLYGGQEIGFWKGWVLVRARTHRMGLFFGDTVYHPAVRDPGNYLAAVDSKVFRNHQPPIKTIKRYNENLLDKRRLKHGMHAINFALHSDVVDFVHN